MKDQVLIDTDIVLLIQRGNSIVTNHALDYITTGNIKHFARIDGLHVENWTL
ncbi:MAG: hypothetical protein AAB116_15795 [Candidatus Poribacteria bacterium]